MSSLDIILPRFFFEKCVDFDNYTYTLKYPLCQRNFQVDKFRFIGQFRTTNPKAPLPKGGWQPNRLTGG